ncbi:MAG TPA: HD domain-containing phosphohydrolase [Acidimicrobiales bacterium]|nr:HD domain-containing phosphohydrolase [Acidimicrobiales bacterium]
MGAAVTPHNRWESRRGAALLVRAVVLAAPLGAGLGASILVGRALGHPAGAWDVAGWWCTVLATSLVTVAVIDRAARRLLPLAVLFRLSLVFPDRAPSRYRVALRAGSIRRLEERARSGEVMGSDARSAAEEVLVLSAALARHDTTTRGHSERVRALTELIADEMGLSGDDRDKLRWAALLHDVGKLSVDAHVLNKPGALDEADWEAVKRHPAEGLRITAHLRDWLGPWTLAIGQHHERWDGSGYPDGLRGDDISRAARIVAVADAYDVMTSVRSYKRPVGPAAARAELAACAGRHFDPDVVRAFLDVSLGRLRLALGLGGALAFPLIPRAFLGIIQPVSAGAVATMVAAAGGLLPIATPAVAPLALGEPQSPVVVEAPPPVPLGAVVPDPAVAPAVAPAATRPPAATAAHAATPAVSPRLVAAPTHHQMATRPAPTASVATAPVITIPRPTRIAITGLVTDTAALVRKSVTVTVAPRHGSYVVDSDGGIHYQPARGYTGPDSFGYSVCDVLGRCFSGTVDLTVV